MKKTNRVLRPRSHHALLHPLPVLYAGPQPRRQTIPLDQLAQGMPLHTHMNKRPRSRCDACGADLPLGSTIFRSEDCDIHTWTLCYSCGAGLMLHFGWATLDDIAKIPAYGGGPGPLDLPVTPF